MCIFSAKSCCGYASGQDKKIGKYYFQAFLLGIVTFDSRYILVQTILFKILLFKILKSKRATTRNIFRLYSRPKNLSSFSVLKNVIFFKEHTENCLLNRFLFQTLIDMKMRPWYRLYFTLLKIFLWNYPETISTCIIIYLYVNLQRSENLDFVNKQRNCSINLP